MRQGPNYTCHSIISSGLEVAIYRSGERLSQNTVNWGFKRTSAYLILGVIEDMARMNEPICQRTFSKLE